VSVYYLWIVEQSQEQGHLLTLLGLPSTLHREIEHHPVWPDLAPLDSPLLFAGRQFIIGGLYSPMRPFEWVKWAPQGFSNKDPVFRTRVRADRAN